MRRVPCLILGVWLSSSVGCSVPAGDGASALVFEDVTVVDGTGAPPRTQQTVVVRDGVITDIADGGSITLPDGATLVDGTGRWLTPGFVDLHVHLPPDSSLHGPVLSRLLEFGVTTILNPGARPGAGPELRDRLERGELLGPQMRTAGRLIDVTPEGREYGAWAAQTPTAEAVREEVRTQSRAGVDFVKLYAGLGPDLVEAAIDEARLVGIPTIGHLESTPWEAAARMGVRMLVHSGWSTPMDDIVNLTNPEEASDTEWYHGYADAPNGAGFGRLVRALVDSGVVVVPTLSITQAGGLGSDASLLPLFRTDLAPERHLPGWWDKGWEVRHPQFEDLGEEEARLMEEVYFPAVLAIHSAFYERGVTLGVGTDVGNSWMTPGVSYHYELGLYQEAGIPPLDILTMATRNGAEALGLGATTGTVEVGKRADLLLLRADPTADIRNASAIVQVYLAGVEVGER